MAEVAPPSHPEGIDDGHGRDVQRVPGDGHGSHDVQVVADTPGVPEDPVEHAGDGPANGHVNEEKTEDGAKEPGADDADIQGGEVGANGDEPVDGVDDGKAKDEGAESKMETREGQKAGGGVKKVLKSGVFGGMSAESCLLQFYYAPDHISPSPVQRCVCSTCTSPIDQRAFHPNSSHLTSPHLPGPLSFNVC